MFTLIGRSGSLGRRRLVPFRQCVRPVLEQLEDRSLLSGAYLETNLVSDLPGVASITDPNLVNPWGIAASPTGPLWIADNAAGVATLYDGSGTPQSLVVTIPPPTGGMPPAAPTGEVFNGTTDFVVKSSGKSGTAVFLFATEDGTISGWSPTVDSTHAILAVDNSASGAVYKGLALGSNASGNLLFATNFNAGTIDTFDKNFKPVALPFKDAAIPAGFAPFGIQNINGKVFVSYAKQNAEKHDDVAGPASGFIDIFDTNGNLIQHFASGGTLNSPWGLALAPNNFGMFSNDLLVGNFGDGLINVFDPTTGKSLGQVPDVHGNTVHIDGLWGLSFGNGGSARGTNTLFFTAGINSERNGLFGSLQPSITGTANERFVDLVYQQLLNRQADPGGLAFWAAQIDQGVTRAQVIAQVEASPEYRTDVIQKTYQRFLHRSADPAGLNFWRNFLQQGGTTEQMDAGIVSSPEYLQARGGGNNDGFLNALFQDALNRPIDTAGHDFFTQELANHFTPGQIATQVFGSPEFQQDLVKKDYLQFLHRPAETGGLNFWVALLQQGQTDEQIAASILASDEFIRPL
jgi:uncharacterized protein (TIGR03118 family)